MSIDQNDDFLSAAKEAQNQQRKTLYKYLGFLSLCILVGLFLFFMSSFVAEETVLENKVSQNEENKTFDCLDKDKDTKFCKTRSNAMKLISSLDKVIQDLENKNTKVWNKESYERLIKSFEIGNRSFNAERYLKAYEELLIAESLSKKLTKEADEILNEGLRLGLEFLDKGEIGEAKEKFEEAQLIEPNNPLAIEGIERARVYNEIIYEINEAKKLIEDGLLDEAYIKINNAYLKDKKNKIAIESLKEINPLISERDFSIAMKKGSEAIERLNPPSGISAFKKALKIKPESQLAKKGLDRILAIDKRLKIDFFLRSALDLEKKENWSNALTNYKNVLSLDNNIELAQDGLLRVLAILDVKLKIDDYLIKKDRTIDFNIRKEAITTINDGKSIINEFSPGPKFRALLQELITLINFYEKPVPIKFLSDNKTKISITRVGVFGPFAEDLIYLKPGKYEIIGMRVGFKDRRLTVNINGLDDKVIRVICNERI